ncbi:MAG: HAD family phosphatase [Rickettsiales bacterium]
MQIRLIIFDFDGTLADSEEINNKAISEVLLSLGHKDYTLGYCMEYFVGCSVHDLIKTLKSLNEKNVEHILDLMKNKAIKLAKRYLKTTPGAIKALSKISLPMSIASNGERDTVLTYSNLLGITKYIDEKYIYTREMVINPKPSPDIYALAAKKTGDFLPENCLAIEDSVIGVSAAKKAGMNVLGFSKQRNNLPLKNAGAFSCISDLKEIFNFL